MTLPGRGTVIYRTMKKILWASGAVLLGCLVAGCLGNGDTGSSRETGAGAAGSAAPEVNGKAYEDVSSEAYAGMFIDSLGKKRFYFDYLLHEEEDFLPNVSYDDCRLSAIVRVLEDGEVTDSCLIRGQVTGYYALGQQQLLLCSGAEESRLMLTQLPDTFGMPVRRTFIQSAKRIEYKKHFHDKNDKSMGLRMYAVVETVPGQQRMVGRELSRLLAANGAEAVPVYENGAAGISGILSHYWRIYQKQYSKNYGGEEAAQDDYPAGGTYYIIGISPAWTSANGDYATYDYYAGMYAGGAHGMHWRYYTTYNVRTGKPLGLTDVFRKEALGKVMALAGRQLAMKTDSYTGAEYENADCFRVVSVGDSLEQMSGFMNAVEHYCLYEGRYYPRPALLPSGIVFSYQPYEKGSFAAGDIHVVLPYTAVASALTPLAGALRP